jgi:hypothetical protein
VLESRLQFADYRLEIIASSSTCCTGYNDAHAWL